MLIVVIAILLPLFVVSTGAILTIYGTLYSSLISLIMHINNFIYNYMSSNVEKIGVLEYSLGFAISCIVLALYIYMNFYAFSNKNDFLTFRERLNASVFTSILIIASVRYTFFSVESSDFDTILRTFRGLILFLPILTIIAFIKDFFTNYKPEIGLKDVINNPSISDTYFNERIHQNTFLKPLITLQNERSSFLVGLTIIFSSGISSYYLEFHILRNMPSEFSYVVLILLILSAIFASIKYRHSDKIKDKKNRRIDEFV